MRGVKGKYDAATTLVVVVVVVVLVWGKRAAQRRSRGHRNGRRSDKRRTGVARYRRVR